MIDHLNLLLAWFINWKDSVDYLVNFTEVADQTDIRIHTRVSKQWFFLLFWWSYLERRINIQDALMNFVVKRLDRCRLVQANGGFNKFHDACLNIILPG